MAKVSQNEGWVDVFSVKRVESRETKEDVVRFDVPVDDLIPVTLGGPLGISVIPIVQESDGLCEVKESMPNEGLWDFSVIHVMIVNEISEVATVVKVEV